MSPCHSEVVRTRIITTRIRCLETKGIDLHCDGKTGKKATCARNPPKGGGEPQHKREAEEHADKNITAWNRNRNTAHSG